ncbi:4'-phosphopantetheinyl transferase superfamily protein [Massilia sp. BSC265]|uniref:4'-phosphopantetheinyl transferase family protein n=1 Tax=Massilia sp. BSC265 TaxID=1549812 RepID=UPI001E503C80|nr:4'-phosphopantetheinyl transferase superfamily protein [Massilia sp. BSC265]
MWLTETGTLPDDALAAHVSWLGEGERRRHTGFVRAERRRQFLAGRVLLRLALGRLLGVAPAGILLHERPGQAPVLTSPTASAVGFSISHTGPWVACAASTETALGLDIERIDPQRDLLALAEQAFGPDEVERLRAHGTQERLPLFYRMWCEQEARIKLGAPVGAMVAFERAGLSGALACAATLAAMPEIEFVSLDSP